MENEDMQRIAAMVLEDPRVSQPAQGDALTFYITASALLAYLKLAAEQQPGIGIKPDTLASLEVIMRRVPLGIRELDQSSFNDLLDYTRDRVDQLRRSIPVGFNDEHKVHYKTKLRQLQSFVDDMDWQLQGWPRSFKGQVVKIPWWKKAIRAVLKQLWQWGAI